MYSARPMVANDLARSISVYTSPREHPAFARRTRACVRVRACFHEERDVGGAGIEISGHGLINEQRRVFFYQGRACY